MRVISGSRRGKKLRALEGSQTRPTTDRVKESIFNIIQFDVPGSRVLDAFAGSGQMAIEALSRGAESAVLVESHKGAQQVIRDNLRATDMESRATLVCGDTLDFLTSCPSHRFDVIFLDPPYGGEMLKNALKIIERFDILAPNGIILCESSLEDQVEVPPRFTSRKDYRYGITAITLIRG